MSSDIGSRMKMRYTLLHKVCTPENLPIILYKANALSYETIFGSLGCRTMHYDSLWLRCQGSGKVMHCMVGGGAHGQAIPC